MFWWMLDSKVKQPFLAMNGKKHEEQPEVGQEIQVLIEDLEDELGHADDPHGLIAISKKKADSIIHWKKIISEVNENDIVTGTVTRKIKGGLLVDIGVQVFLPASQVDIRCPGDIADSIGKVVQCEDSENRRTATQ